MFDLASAESVTVLEGDRELSISELLDWDDEIMPRLWLADIPEDFGADSD